MGKYAEYYCYRIDSMNFLSGFFQPLGLVATGDYSGTGEARYDHVVGDRRWGDRSGRLGTQPCPIWPAAIVPGIPLSTWAWLQASRGAAKPGQRFDTDCRQG